MNIKINPFMFQISEYCKLHNYTYQEAWEKAIYYIEQLHKQIENYGQKSN